MPFKISRTFMDDEFPNPSFDDKVSIFQDRVIGWQLEVARHVVDAVPDSSFAVIHILASYFEMFGKFQEGNLGNASRKFFVMGLRDAFPDIPFTKSETDLVYEEFRCSLYHVALTGPKVLLSRDYDHPLSIGITNNGTAVVKVNPQTLPRHLEKHFRSYIRKLRDPVNVDLRTNFEKRFDHQGQPFRKSTTLGLEN